MDAGNPEQGPHQDESVRPGLPTLAVVVAVIAAVLAAMLLVRQTRDTSAAPAPTPPPTGATAGDVDLEFAVWGADEEIAAYESIVDDYNASAEHVDVTLLPFDDAEALRAALESDEIDPDLFLLPRTGLAETLAEGRNIPLLDLLDARGLAFGDDYSRDSVAAFSVDDNLQCMPYGTSPMVMYYNTDLIDFEAIAERGQPVPNEEHTSWSLEAFAAAAEFASRPRLGTRGVEIEPTLEGLAPFILSGGGELYDDPTLPTTLALSEDSSVDAIRRTLELLRDPKITLTTAQQRRKSSVEWFSEGKVAMIAGYRDLVPQLREVEGLEFDVLPMPSLGSAATIGDLSGLCIGSGHPADVGSAADFLVYLVSDEAVARISEVGFLQPTHVQVAFSDAFLQPGRAPANAGAFNQAARAIRMQPLIEDLDLLDAAVATQVRQLFTAPVLDDLERLLADIDATSRTILDPENATPTDDPSDLPGESSDGSDEAGE